MVEIFTDERCLEHDAGPGFPERPERLRRVLAGVAPAGGREVRRAGDHPRQREVVEAVHDPPYLGRFERAAERGDGLLDSADNPLTPGTWRAAWGAVAATLHAADSVAAGGAGRQSFAAVRPPGHHAEHALAMGFCFFNNVAVAAEHLRRGHGVERVAIFDFDVHHGNGTQHLFERRCDVYYASTHQYPFYPGTGAGSEIGIGPGRGCTLNVPLAAGTGDEGYAAALEAQILPGLRAHQPEVLLVSAGFDAWARDPLGGMRVSAAGFTAWGRGLAGLAEELCGGRLLSVLEGGYDLDALGALAGAYLDGLEGRPEAGGQTPGAPAGPPPGV